ncbi:hypothetical protein BS47DRAFT_1365013 [Hydnum rufescens UP504]|uniref:Transposase n=1 Tax=Hydnum rufescens UP504 TaxID=1448309 RepID=A0A9P6APY2_9AGAM|nr:hypothetical protein BS47DRAFT_1365013 [Hydnum rufescens UP504]
MMYKCIEKHMPQAPGWKSTTVVLDDALTEPQTFFYQDPVELADFLFGNLTPHNSMLYEPIRVFEADGKTQVYHEMVSGKLWNEVQCTLPNGVTVMGVVLASDETHLTNFSGNKSMHAVYMTLGNISRTVFAMKMEAECMPGILQCQLFHHCMWIVFESMQVGHQTIHATIDPEGNIHQCLAVLMAWIADLKEQYNIVGLATNSCPQCLARYKDLEHPYAFPPHTSLWITNEVHHIHEELPISSTTWQFISRAKAVGLCGIKELCWEELGVDICQVICMDNLHGLHKMFKDHMMEWLTKMIGQLELNCRFTGQPHHIEAQNFDTGADGAQSGVIKAIQVVLDFIYITQFPLHSDSSLQELQVALSVFHDNKCIFIVNGACHQDHMNIQKVHALHHWASNIVDLGTTDNYCTETGKTLHILMCKAAYKATNHK